MNEKAIVKAIFEYQSCHNLSKRISQPNFTEWKLSSQSVKLLVINSNAILLGAIFDRLIIAEKAWEAPYNIKKRIGHLNINIIANMEPKELSLYIGNRRFQPSFHRFLNVMANCVIKACNLIIDKYNGDAKNI